MKILRNEKGFTLIELVLIIIVLGLLAAVAIVQFGTITTDARNAALQGAVGPYSAQLAIAVNTIRGLPTGGGDAVDTGCGVGVSTTFEDCVYFDVLLTGSGLVLGSYVAANNSFAICTGTAACGTAPNILANGAAPGALGGGACAAPDRYVVLDYQTGTGAIFVSATAACP